MGNLKRIVADAISEWLDARVEDEDSGVVTVGESLSDVRLDGQFDMNELATIIAAAVHTDDDGGAGEAV